MLSSGGCSDTHADQFKNTKFLKGIKNLDFDGFLKLPPLRPFSDECIDFLNLLSKEINKDLRLRDYPDVSSFSFFAENQM